MKKLDDYIKDLEEKIVGEKKDIGDEVFKFAIAGGPEKDDNKIAQIAIGYNQKREEDKKHFKNTKKLIK